MHDLSAYVQNISGRFTLGFTQYSFTGLTVDNYEATTGFEYRLHEKWTFLVDGGARYTQSNFQTVAAQSTAATGSAPIGTVKLTYTGEVGTMELSANRDVLPAYGAIGTLDRTIITATVSRKFTYKLSGSLFTGFSPINRNQPSSRWPLLIPRLSMPRPLRYEFTKNMYLKPPTLFSDTKTRSATRPQAEIPSSSVSISSIP